MVCLAQRSFASLEEFYFYVRRKARRTSKIEFVVSKCIGKKVLDCGCVDHEWIRAQKPDWLHKQIRKVANTVVGLDILLEDLRSLSKMGYDRLICADVQALPFIEAFDVVVIGDLIEHVSDPGSLLRSVSHCLIPGGEVIITTPNPFYVNQFLSIVISNRVTVNDEHVCWFDPLTLYTLLGRHGFIPAEFYWLHDSWGKWDTASWLSGNRRLIRFLSLPGYLMLGTLRLLRHLRRYLSSDFAILARKIS